MSRLRAAVMAFAVFTVFSLPAWSAEEADAAQPSDDQSATSLTTRPFNLVATTDSANGRPIPLVLNATGNGFDFDLGGSETRKLHIYLDSPLSVNAPGLGLETQALSYPGRNVLGLDATLELPLSPTFSLTGNFQRSQEQARFQPVGSIRCTEGVLRPYSYTASGCRFVGEPLGGDSFTGLDRSGLSIGARFDTPSTSTAISWFTQDSNLGDSGVNRVNSVQPTMSMGTDLLTPVIANPLLPGLPVRQPLNYHESEASGVDLSFRLGVATDNHGDLQFGLALTRVLDAELGGLYSSLTPWGWTISDSFDTAQMNVEWNHGPFSTGIQGFYRDQVDFLNRNSLDSLTTFDVHFTWRTPWNADLSVGASNILNAGAEDGGTGDSQPTDPFESIYGRIPYVRYKQDL